MMDIQLKKKKKEQKKNEQKYCYEELLNTRNMDLTLPLIPGAPWSPVK